jgi:two-component system chemotaxis sensor kinase CheA
VVERILDIVEDRADVRSATNRAAVLYSVVIGNRVTELLDIAAILRSADLGFTRLSPAMKSTEVPN